MVAVLKREFRSYFQNVIGWLFVAALMALFGLYFYVYNLRQVINTPAVTIDNSRK